jgi:REP element-mobilizing transposase RayT
MAHTFTDLLTHLVFSTKDRVPLIREQLRTPLFPYMAGICRELGAHTYIINGPADHVHLLLTMPHTVAVSDFLRVLKANSSKWIREQFPREAFAWQIGYGAFSVSRSDFEDVEQYIRDQEKHHQKMDFKREFIALLKKHGLEPDEYIWE